MSKVSICIPVYNDPDELKRLLDSIEEQTYTDYEVIITDDSDDDRIENLVERFRERLDNITYLRNQKKLGHIYNWNKAISLANGEYTKIMFSDDWFTDKDSLSKLVRLLDENQDAGMAFSSSMQVSKERSYARKFSDGFIDGLKADYRDIFAGNEIGAPSDVIYRGHDVMFDEKTNWASDVELYLHLLSHNSVFAYTEEPLISIGIHEDQYTNQFSSGEKRIENDYRYIYEKYDLSENEKCRSYMEGRKEHIRGSHRSKNIISSAVTAGTGRIDISQIGKMFFYIGLTLELFYVLWDRSVWQIGNDGILFRISFVFLLLKVLLTKYTKHEKFAVLVFCVIGFIAYRCSSRNDVLRVIILIAACKDVDIKRMLKYVFGVMLAGCLALVLMSIFGIAGDISRTAEYRTGLIETRYVFGMGHPNALHCMFWALLTLGMLIYWDRLKWYHYIVFAAANLGLYKLTDSRTGFLMTMLAIVLAAFLGIRGNKIKGIIAGWAGMIGTLAAAGISLAAAYYGLIYNNNGLWNESHFEKVRNIDRVLFNGRLWNAYGYPDSHIGVFTLFSTPGCTRHMDLGYYKLFYTYGYIPAILYITAIILLLWYGMKKKKYGLIMFVTSWAAYNLLEAHEISEYIGRNYLYLLMGAYWMQILKADDGEERYWICMRDGKARDIPAVRL